MLLLGLILAVLDLVVGVLYNLCFSVRHVALVLVMAPMRSRTCRQHCLSARCKDLASGGLCPKWDPEPSASEEVQFQCCGPTRTKIEKCFRRSVGTKSVSTKSVKAGSESVQLDDHDDVGGVTVENPLGAAPSGFSSTFEVEVDQSKSPADI